MHGMGMTGTPPAVILLTQEKQNTSVEGVKKERHWKQAASDNENKTPKTLTGGAWVVSLSTPAA